MGASLFNSRIDLHMKKPFISSLGQLLLKNYIQIRSWSKKIKIHQAIGLYVCSKKNSGRYSIFLSFPPLNLKEETLRVS